MIARREISAPAAFRALLNSGEFLVSPGVYDGYSARLVEAAGFKSACTSGAQPLVQA